MQPSNTGIEQSEDDFSELESLLNPKPLLVESKLGEAPDSDGFEELEELLGEALKDKKLADAVKTARAKAKGGFGLSAEDLDRIREWELAKEWLPVANVALFRQYSCNCGYHSTLFEGLMLEQKHRTDSHANRWVTQEASALGLPNKTAIRKASVVMCQQCAASKGYTLLADIIWEL